MRRLVLVALSLVLGAPGLRAQSAGEFPTRAVTIIAAGSAGGPTDVITRLVAEGMARDLGQPVVVENAPGSTVPSGRAAQARPDGHTLLINNIGFAASATLYRRLPYDVPQSFAPLGLVSEAAMTLPARPGFPADDVDGFLAEIRRQGDRLNLANSGLGSASHLCGMLLQQAVGTNMTTVVFRGSAQIMTDLMADRVDVFCDQATNTLPYIREGRVKAYAVTGEHRVPGLDRLPTTAEAGVKLSMTTWHALYAPAATPEPVQRRLSAALQASLREGRLRQRFAELVTAPASAEQATSEFHRRFLAEEIARWRPLIQEAGAYAD